MLGQRGDSTGARARPSVVGSPESVNRGAVAAWIRDDEAKSIGCMGNLVKKIDGDYVSSQMRGIAGQRYLVSSPSRMMAAFGRINDEPRAIQFLFGETLNRGTDEKMEGLKVTRLDLCFLG